MRVPSLSTPSEVTAREIERDYGVRSVGVVPNVTGGLIILSLLWIVGFILATGFSLIAFSSYI